VPKAAATPTRRAVLTAALGAASLRARRAAAAEPVDLQLVLAADVSRSINEDRFRIQRQGYASAIADPRVVRAMTSGANGRIALTFFEWSGAGAQRTIVDWTLIQDQETAEVFAASLLPIPRPFAGPTAIGEAIRFAMEELARCPYPSSQRVIDVSGDGTNNNGVSVEMQRDLAVAAGITVNGLAILSAEPSPFNPQHTHPPGGLDEYYRRSVTGGPGSFMLSVLGFETFGFAMVNKLSREVA
jgi:hypothetical protein